MGTFGNELGEQLKHAFQSFIAAMVILFLAAIFAACEKLCIKLEMPEYYLFCARVIAVALLIIDGIVVIGISLILAGKLLKNQLSNKQYSKP